MAGTLDVVLQLQALKVLSLAMAHNGIPIIEQLTVMNQGPSLHGAVLKAEVRDSEGLLSTRWEQAIDLPTGAQVALDGIALRLDAAAMHQVVERRPGAIKVSLEHEGDTKGETSVPVDVLAGMHWLVASPVGLSLEMLAAHVMPNSPEVADLLKDASTLLTERTGSPSLQGYQSGADRVDAIVSAIYEAMQGRNIRYAEPPASWADQGQKVRTPAEVFGNGIGTCLDTVVVMAACLEQAGVRPLLWVVKGHAFLGYWRIESALESIAQSDVAAVVNQVDLGHIGLIETTLVTAGEQRVPFERAGADPYSKYLSGDLDDVLAVVDVWTARSAQLLPLPARARTSDGTVQIVEYRPAIHSTPQPSATPPAAAPSESTMSTHRQLPQRVEQWKNTLLDLSLRNKLINFSSRASISLAIPGTSLGQAEDLLHEGKALQLLPSDQLDELVRARGIRSARQLAPEALADLLAEKGAAFCDVPMEPYPTRLRNLAYKARTIVEETGANNLYLALGSLVWSIEGRELRSPLVLVPVSLKTRARSQHYQLELDESGTSTPNYCLLEKLRQLHGISVPGLAEPKQDQSGIDLDAAFQAMRQVLAAEGLPFRVDATADLAILQFAKFRLWKDIDEGWETLEKSALVRHLAHTPQLPFTDPVDADVATDLDELATKCPIPADSSQLQAVAHAVAGKTFVLEGPPGTGKSQTITNLLARAMADGRRVLFVAEKRAALDVVKGRLDAVGLGPFSLDLHDKGSKPAVVRAQISAALDHKASVDRIGLEARTDDLKSSARALRRYADRLHDANGAGLSFYSARDKLLAVGDEVRSIPVPSSLLGDSGDTRVELVRKLLRGLPEVADPAQPGTGTPWGFVGIDRADPDAMAEISRLAQRIDADLANLSTAHPLSGVLSAARSQADLTTLANLVKARHISVSTLDETRTGHWQSASASLRHEVDVFVSAAHPGLDVATPAALDLPLADIHAAAQAAAASSWFGRKKRLRSVLERLEPTLKPGAVVEPKRVPELTGALVQLQGAARHLATRAAGVPGVAVPHDWNPLTDEGRAVVANQLTWLEWAGRVVDVPATDAASFTDQLRKLLSSGVALPDAVVSALESLALHVSALATATQSSQDAMAAWSGHAGLVPQWQATSRRRDTSDTELRSLTRWLALREHLAPLTQLGMAEAVDLLLRGVIEADEATRSFERGLAETSLRERPLSTGLDAFQPSSHERTIARFLSASDDVRRLLPAALADDVTRTRQFNAGADLGQVGALRRELSKQRRGLGVRALMQQYGELIVQLMPCVLVSPDSLARFFPVEAGLFDIVVFDEASQIRVADAIGAIGRAKSVVVVGDSKQMPPTVFAESSTDADEDSEAETVVEDEESILSECVQAGVEKQWLSWHYRSQDEALISFSNHHYYEGRLSSFPAPTAGTADPGVHGHGVSLVRVPGTFHRSGKGKLLRTNPEEAQAVVDEIVRRFDAAPAGSVPSIGVVTFNQQQRAFIEALIRDGRDERLTAALDSTEDEGLFIKNLENVQGDERDVILFSTAFSVNEKGVLPLNFGPLNRGGGERRLNVAVTRARRQVVIFSSFDPQQLRAEETSSVGIKHLRAYLDLAAHGPSGTSLAASRTMAVDRHRDEIADALRARGYAVRTDVGLSDFRVDLAISQASAPDRPLAAVLLDGPAWAARGTVGDRDGLPGQVLQRMLRWPTVVRVWLPSWLEDCEAVLERIEDQIRRGVDPVRDDASHGTGVTHNLEGAASLVTSASPGRFANLGAPSLPGLATSLFEEELELSQGPPPLIPLPTALGHSDGEPEAGGTTLSLPGEELFEPWHPPALGGRDVLDALDRSRSAQRQVREALEQAVEAEGPVHPERLAKLVASAFDLSRVNAARSQAILEQLPNGIPRDTTESFVWSSTRPHTTWSGFRRDVQGLRPIEHLSLREIANSMVALCSATGGMERDELMREALGLFGGRRLTAGITARLSQALEGAEQTGQVTRRTSGHYVA